MPKKHNIRSMKRGEIGYVTSWTEAGCMTANVTKEPGGTVDTRIRRKWWGFEFVDRPKDTDRRNFTIVLTVVLVTPFALMGGGGALMASGWGAAWETVGGVLLGVGGLWLAAMLLAGFGGP